MSSPLSVRRRRGFRPQVYSLRHREVARLLAQGKSRAAIARETGYSITHISRIAGMRETQEHIARNFARLAVWMIKQDYATESFDAHALLIANHWRSSD